METEIYDANYYIKHLNLKPHPETGFFAETYRTETESDGISSISSAYYLIKTGTTTIFRILSQSDEINCYHAGRAFEILVIETNGNMTFHKIGKNIEKGEKLHAHIPKTALASFKVREYNKAEGDGSDFSLFACVCGPAFDFNRFSLVKDEELINRVQGINLELINQWRNDFS